MKVCVFVLSEILCRPICLARLAQADMEQMLRTDGHQNDIRTEIAKTMLSEELEIMSGQNIAFFRFVLGFTS